VTFRAPFHGLRMMFLESSAPNSPSNGYAQQSGHE
jgi:hypothetical protein